MQADDKRLSAGVLLALGSAFFYATRSVLVRVGLEQGAGVRELVAVRMFVAAALFLATDLYLRYRHKRVGTGLCKKPQMFLAAAAFSTAVVSSFFSVDLIGVSMAVVLIYAHPVFVQLLARIFFGEKLGVQKALTLVAAYAGCLLVVGPRMIEGDPLRTLVGGGLALTAAACYAVYQLLTQKLSSSESSVSIGAATAYLSLIPALALWHFDPVIPTDSALVVGATLGVVSTYLPLLMVIAAINRLGAAQASMYSLVGPVLAIILAAVIFSETMNPLQWAGSILVLASGSWLMLMSKRKKSPVT